MRSKHFQIDYGVSQFHLKTNRLNKLRQWAVIILYTYDMMWFTVVRTSVSAHRNVFCARKVLWAEPPISTSPTHQPPQPPTRTTHALQMCVTFGRWALNGSSDVCPLHTSLLTCRHTLTQLYKNACMEACIAELVSDAAKGCREIVLWILHVMTLL